MTSTPFANKTTFAQRRTSILIVLFLAVQLVLPLRYYLGGGTDERFCWRMFSSVAKRQCRASIAQTLEQADRRLVRSVSLSSILPTWSVFFHRHPVIVRKLLHWRCQFEAVQTVRYECRCTTVDGLVLVPVHMTFDCATCDIRSGP